jgi:hypothetical protein
MPIPGECTHYDTFEGPRVPLRWGTSATVICKLCALWRQEIGNKKWRAQPIDTERDNDL